MSNTELPPIKVEAYGTITPPPPPDDHDTQADEGCEED